MELSKLCTPGQILLQKKIKDEVKMLGSTISEDKLDATLEEVFYNHFVLERAWDKVLDKAFKRTLPSDQLEKLKLLQPTAEDLTMDIAIDLQIQTEVAEIHSSSLEETMVVEDEENPVASHEEKPVTSHKEKPVANPEEDLIQELNRELVRVEPLLSTQNIPTQQELMEIAKFYDKLASAEQTNNPKQHEIKQISKNFVDQIIDFAESMADVIQTHFSEQQISKCMYGFEIIEKSFKALADLKTIPKVSNSRQFQKIFWPVVTAVHSQAIASQEAALAIISNFSSNGSNRESNEALTLHLKFLERVKWIDDYVDHRKCQPFSSEIKKEICDCVEKFTKSLIKINLNDEKNNWMDEISAIESKGNTLLSLKLVAGNSEVFKKFSVQVQDMKAKFFANIMTEFPLDTLKRKGLNSLNISKAVTALELLKNTGDCNQAAKYKADLEGYLKRDFTSIMKCFQQLKTAIDNVNSKIDLKDFLEAPLDNIRTNSRIAAGYLDNLKLIKDKYSIIRAFISKEEVDSFLNDLRNLKKTLAIELEQLCNKTHSAIAFHSKLQLIQSLIGLDGYIPDDGELFSELHKKHFQNYEGQLKTVYNETIRDLKNDKFEAVVTTMKRWEHTSPPFFLTIRTELENYLHDLIKKVQQETVFLNPFLPPEQRERFENELKALEDAKTYIPKGYLPHSYNKLVDCIASVEAELSYDFSNTFGASHSQPAKMEDENIEMAIKKANAQSADRKKLELNKIKFVQFYSKIKESIENRRGLLHLSLNDCGLETLKGFPELPDLISCELTDNSIEGSELSHLSHLTRLRTLSLGGNLISNVEDLERLEPLKDLMSLNLHGCPVSHRTGYRKKVFAMLCNLQELDNETKDLSDMEDEKEDKKERGKEEKRDNDILQRLETLQKSLYKPADTHYGERISHDEEGGGKKVKKD